MGSSLLATSAAKADVVTLSPAATGQFTTSLAEPNTVSVTTPNALFSDYDPSAQQALQFGMEFSLEGLPSGAFISSAILQWFEGQDILQGSDPIALFSYLGDGVVTESDLSSPAGLVSAQINDGVGAPFFLDVTGAVAASFAGNASHIGFLSGTPVSEETYLLVLTDEFFGGAGPRLQITYTAVPEVGSLSLGASAMGLMGVAVWKRRRKTYTAS